MAFVVKTFKVLRNNWKKSTFGFVVLTYSGSALKNRHDTNVLMKACCEEAAKYGDELLPISVPPRSVTVILNPAANKRKAKTEYEKYCDPLLHLAGIRVNVLQTTAEGHAKELVDEIPENESIIIAGGDGTLCETITGILRKDENNVNRAIGILPLGQRNFVGNLLFPVENHLKRVRQLTEATMAVIRNETQLRHVMKIETIESNEETPAKPIFALSNIEWGAFRDAIARRDKYWVYGRLREYATYIFNGYKSSLCWECKGTLKYSPPCDGCNNCRTTIVDKPKKFSLVDLFIPKDNKTNSSVDYSKVVNKSCNEINELCFKTTELNIFPIDGGDGSPPSLNLELNKMGLSYLDFIKEGWSRVGNKELKPSNKAINARSIELLPLNVSTPENEVWFNIDNEEFDVKPIKITILPNIMKIYCKNIN